jgi:hypothetical protein
MKKIKAAIFKHDSAIVPLAADFRGIFYGK